jgi:hypothetical protein
LIFSWISAIPILGENPKLQHARANPLIEAKKKGPEGPSIHLPTEGPRQARPPLELLPIGRHKPRDRILKPNLPLELG